ncbi:MAG: hypothetical protein MZU95_01175 [Desulfomicrobium escambiense]|nr:hypothetical protein [Desulfomicrobium escambiense]
MATALRRHHHRLRALSRRRLRAPSPSPPSAKIIRNGSLTLEVRQAGRGALPRFARPPRRPAAT